MKIALVLALLASTGCTSLSLKGERVRLTTSPADVTDCRAVGEVASTTFTVPHLKHQPGRGGRRKSLDRTRRRP